MRCDTRPAPTVGFRRLIRDTALAVVAAVIAVLGTTTPAWAWSYKFSNQLLQAASTGQCLAATGGTTVATSPCADSPVQRWTMTYQGFDGGHDRFVLVNAANGACLTPAPDGQRDGGPVGLGPCPAAGDLTAGAAQWTATRDGGGTDATQTFEFAVAARYSLVQRSSQLVTTDAGAAERWTTLAGPPGGRKGGDPPGGPCGFIACPPSS